MKSILLYKYRFKQKLSLLIVLLSVAVYLSAQTYFSTRVSHNPDENQTPLNTQDSTKQTKSTKGQSRVIEVKQADEYNRRPGVDYEILIGNVWFYHDGINLYCDSSHFSRENNSFQAFGNVKMEQGDTIFLYGKYMEYDGNQKLVRVRQNVRMEKDTSVTLFTDSLDYDRIRNIGYYFNGGMLVDSLNQLTSYWGQYEPGKNQSLFIDSVKLVNPKFTLTSDTLWYNTKSKISHFTSPTKITSDSGTIYTTNGWYNTSTEQSLLLDQSTIYNLQGNRILRGDSMLYNRREGIGQIFGNMFLQDTTKKVILKGNYGFYNEKNNYAYATDSAHVIEYNQKDSLFLHADTIKLIPDSTFKMIRAYYNVRFYRSDIQGICDSMQFNSRDSVLHLYNNPVLWNENNQLSGDTIDVFMNDSTINYIHVKRSSYSIEQKDSIHFNQLKSRSLKIFFDNKNVKNILAEGSVENIVYPDEKDKSLKGVQNYLISSYLLISLNDGKLERFVAWPKPEGHATPFHLLADDKLNLEGFYWYDYLRPMNKNDIFRNTKRKPSDIRPVHSSIFDRIQK